MNILPRILMSEKGAPNGVATLDSNKIIHTTQLPSYVDDVLEYNMLSGFPATGEAGKIYVAKDTNKTYRWSGTGYIYITSGAVDSVAGKTGVVLLAKSDIGLSEVDNTSDADKSISTATQSVLNLKVDKVTGKGLSTEDYSTAEKAKLASISTPSVNTYYFDSVRNRYLDLSTKTVTFYLDGNAKKNMYMYSNPLIFSSLVPERIFEEYALIAVEVFTTKLVPTGTTYMEIRNMPAGTLIKSISNNSGFSITEFYDNSLNILIPNGTKLAAYILAFGMDNPVLKLHLKKTYYPIGV